MNSAVSQTNWKQCVWKRMIVEIVERSKKGNINKISNLFPISPLYEISLLLWTGFVVFLWLLFQPICIYYFSPEIHFCSRIFLDSWIEWHTRNAGNSWRPNVARAIRKRWSYGGAWCQGTVVTVVHLEWQD